MRKFRLWLCLTLTILLTSANYAQNRNSISTKSNLSKREFTHPGSIQIDRNPSNLELTPEQLLQKYFTKGNFGDAIITNVKSNLHYWDDKSQKWTSETNRTISYFQTPDDVLKYFPFKEGIVFGPTDIHALEGPNDHLLPTLEQNPYVDYDFERNTTAMIQQLTSEYIRNKSVIQFDFLATTTTMSFKYMFASSEYPDFVGRNYNDVFGFFIQEIYESGDLSEARNIALIDFSKDATPENYVSINTINGGGLSMNLSPQDPDWHFKKEQFDRYNLLESYTPQVPSTNSQLFQQIPMIDKRSPYYVTIPQDASEEVWGYHNSIGINGRTVPLEAKAEVTPCKKYRLTLLVVNIEDNQHPSVVFLEGGSFDAGILPKYNIPLSNGTIVESDKVYPGHDGSIEIDLGFNAPKEYRSQINYLFDNDGKEIMLNNSTPNQALPDYLVFNKNASYQTINYKIADNNNLIGKEYSLNINGFCGTGKLTDASIYVIDPNFKIVPEISCNSQTKEYYIVTEVEGGLGYFEYRILAEDHKTVIKDWQWSNAFTLNKEGTYILQVKDLAYINKLNPNAAIKDQTIRLGGGDIHVSISRKKMGDTINLISLAKWPENTIIEFNENAMPINHVDLQQHGLINSSTLKENGTYIFTFNNEDPCQTNSIHYYYLTITE